MKELRPPLPELPDTQLRFIPDFISSGKADQLLQEFLANFPWRQDSVRVFGKTYSQPRLTALFGTEGSTYSYSGLTLEALAFPKPLMDLKTAVEQCSGRRYNSCLANLYRDGQDSNGWHADNEKELGPNPCIASISLGAERWFHLKHRNHPQHAYKIALGPGSLLLMEGSMQHHWVHQIPKTRKPIGPRINLTFRYLY